MGTAESTGFYDDDLAYVHDAGFSGLSESWAPELLEMLRESGIETGTVVDLGCGGGGWIEHLANAGYQPVGVDLSPAMIERSRQRVPSASFQVASVWEYSIPRCRAVTALSEVLCYRTGNEDEPNPQMLFKRVFKSLEPGGVFIFDIAEVGLDQGRDRTFAEGDDWACLVKFEYDETRDRLHRHITTFRRVDTSYRRSHERHTVQLYEARHVEEIMADVGFDVQLVRQFGAAALLPKRIGFVATKPE